MTYAGHRRTCLYSVSCMLFWTTSPSSSGLNGSTCKKHYTDRRNSLKPQASNLTSLPLALPQALFPNWDCFLNRSFSPELLTLTCPSHIPVSGPFCFLCRLASAFIVPDTVLYSYLSAPPSPCLCPGQSLSESSRVSGTLTPSIVLYKNDWKLAEKHN